MCVPCGSSSVATFSSYFWGVKTQNRVLGYITKTVHIITNTKIVLVIIQAPIASLFCQARSAQNPTRLRQDFVGPYHPADVR